MKYLISSFFLLLSFCVFAQKQFVVDEHATLREISASFSSIEVSSGIHLYLSKGGEETVAVSAAEEKNRDNIKTEVDNNVLKIFYRGDAGRSNYGRRITVYVSYKNLEQINASGACNVLAADEINVPIFGLKLSGASDFKGKLKVNDFSIKVSGASDAKISGTAKNSYVECNGASDLKAFELETETATIKASGASDVSITVTKEITANASGASNITYKGGAELKGKKSGGSSAVSHVD